VRALLTVLCLSVACNPPPPVEQPIPGTHEAVGEVVLTANGRKVTDKMMAAVTSNTPEPTIEQRKATGAYAKIVEQVGLGEVLYQAAVDEKLHEDPEIQLALAMSARETLAQEYFKRKINEKVTDGRVKQYYDERAVQYKRPQTRASHILIKDKAVADEVKAKLDAGGDFAKLAAEYSEDTMTKDKGGDLGWFQREKLIAEVADVAFEQELNKAHGPVETRYGYHIILPTERRDAIPLADVEGEIKNKLRNDAAELIMKEIRGNLVIERFGEVKEMHEKLESMDMPSTKATMPGGAPHGAGGPPHGGGAPGAPPHGAGGPH
jgi:hypothetical protein